MYTEGIICLKKDIFKLAISILVNLHTLTGIQQEYYKLFSSNYMWMCQFTRIVMTSQSRMNFSFIEQMIFPPGTCTASKAHTEQCMTTPAGCRRVLGEKPLEH